MGVGNSDALREQVVEAMNGLVLGNTYDDPHAQMGPVIDGGARDRLFTCIESAIAEGLTVARDGREGVPDDGFFVGPTLVDQVEPGRDIFRQELFGPVLSMLHPETLDEAIAWFNQLPYGNAATLFTQNGNAARQFTREVECGMIGINLGVPAPVALFPFSGWDESFFGDLHVQGKEGVMFYTQQKTVLSRW